MKRTVFDTMNEYFQTMNEAYIDKHYPNRSIFESVAKSTKKAGIAVYFFFGILLAGSLAGLLWSINAINTYKLNGEMDMVSVGTVICIVFAVFALLSVLMIALTIWRGKRNSEDWLKKSAENSKLSESELREFERQAMASDSYILKLLNSVNAAVAGRKDGILTREYIYLADSNLTVIRCEDLINACLVDTVIYVGPQKNRKAVHALQIQLRSKHGVESFAEVSPEAGKALTQLLLQKYPTIDICDGNVMTEREYDKYKKTALVKS